MTPRPDQFFYVELAFSSGPNGKFWLSMDGAHDGLMIRPELSKDPINIAACINGRQRTTLNGKFTDQTADCQPTPAYDPTFAMSQQALAEQITSDSANATTMAVGKQLLQNLEFQYMTPTQTLNLLNAASSVAGFNAKTTNSVAGGTQTTVTWTVANAGQNDTMGIVFDAKARFVGTTLGDRVVRSSVVDKIGVTPA